ncbi:MAG: DUF1080 domain-containing protein [Candidatus Hydrogenedentes bacterium]|nr:DUF1080 domain-containing protein [Candidatus Hydrogenedentota bacterium]
MGKRIVIAFIAAALGACSVAGTQEPAVSLFNGKDLEGWYTFIKDRGRDTDPKGVFGVKDGMIHITGEEWGCITTNEEFENFRLVVEFKWGEKTWANREKAARDSGVLIHSVGEDGGYSGIWMHSIECQVIEGGTGDFIVVGDDTDKFFVTCPVAPEMQGTSHVFAPEGNPATITTGRINWWGRDPAWTDIKGFRGAKDVEKPAGEWNVYEIIADAKTITVNLNGVLVNRALDCAPARGRIQIQSEGAELFVRKVELAPFKKNDERAEASPEITFQGAAGEAEVAPAEASETLAAPPAPALAPGRFDPEQDEPGLSYGHSEDLPLPRTILFSAGPEELIKDAAAWVQRGVTAFFLDNVARDWSSDIWATDGEPWTIGYADATYAKCIEANKVCKAAGAETYLKIAFDRTLDWSNDLQFQALYQNFRQFALFAQRTGCTGIALDIEYIGDQYSYDWPGYTYANYKRADLAARVRDRMGKAIRFMYAEWPEMVLLTFPEEGFSLGTIIHAAWIEEAARLNAPGGVHYCLEHTYRNANIRYVYAHAWGINQLFQRILSEPAKAYWKEHCTIAAGVWPLGFNYQDVHDAGMTQEQFQQAFAASLMVSPRYNWVYSHNSREQLLGRNLGAHEGEEAFLNYINVVPRREIITSQPYLDLAKRVRALEDADYSQELGVLPVPVFAGPNDVPRIEPMPLAETEPVRTQHSWDMALAYLRGEPSDLQEQFATVTNWMVIGPFPNEESRGHGMVYPPEQKIDLNGVYGSGDAKARWREYRGQPERASVDFKAAFQPSDNLCAYAVCWVTAPAACEAQLRVGTNDSGKVWLGGTLVYEHTGEGTAVLDRDVVDIALPAGTMPILVKVCNGTGNWGFVLRLSDRQGQPLRSLSFSPVPPVQPELALLVVNKHEDTMSFLDPVTLHEFARVATGHDPHEIAVTPDRRFAYISNYAEPGNTVSLIDLVEKKHVTQIPTGEFARIHSAAMAPDGKFVYFTAGQSGHVVEISTETNEVKRGIPTQGKISHMVVVSPDGARLYTANIESQNVSVIERASGSLLAQVPCEAGCEGMAFTPDGSRLWVANQNAGSITIIDPQALHAEATIPCPGTPLRIRFTQDGKRALVTNWVAAGELVIIDTATRQEVKRLRVGDQPIGVEISPDQQRAFVTSMTSSEVHVIDLVKLEVTGRLYTGLGCDAMAWWRP